MHVLFHPLRIYEHYDYQEYYFISMIWPECFTFFAVNLVPESHMASSLADCRSSEDLIDADKLNSGA